MRLYHSPMAISLACRLALTAAEADHDIIIVNSLSGQTKLEPHLSINPLGEVPVLECEGAFITQTIAILKFIADRAGAGAEGGTAIRRAKALSIMVLAAVEVQGAWRMINRPARYVTDEAAQSELSQLALARLDAAYIEVERQLGSLEPGTTGMLEYYLTVFALWKAMAPAGKDLSPSPRLDELKERIMAIPKLAAVINEDIASFTALVS